MKNWVDKSTKWIYIKGQIWELTKLWVMQHIEKTSRGPNLERPNVEWPIFRNPNISFIFSKLFEHQKYLIIFQILRYGFSKL